MNDRAFCHRAATLAVETIRERFSHIALGANDYSVIGPGLVLFFGNEEGHASAPPDDPPIVAQLREYLAIEEVGIHELGFATSKDRRSWALLAESRRDLDYCRRLVWKAFGAVRDARTPRREA